MPPGFKYGKHPVYKAVLTLDPARAPLVKEALEGFATDRFASPTEVLRFLASRASTAQTRACTTPSTWGRCKTMLRCVLYAGYLEYKPWGISLRKAHHPALICLQTSLHIQQKLLDRKPTTTHAKTGTRTSCCATSLPARPAGGC